MQKKEAECYVHVVSPMKTAISNNRKYFNCTIQEKKSHMGSLFFPKKKHSKLKTVQQTKSAIKMENFAHARNDENGDLLMYKYTKIVPIDSTTIPFPYLDNLTATGVNPSPPFQV